MDIAVAMDHSTWQETRMRDPRRLTLGSAQWGMPYGIANRHACGGRLWRTLLAEREAGRIDALGISAATPEEAWAALADPNIEVLQVASSLLD